MRIACIHCRIAPGGALEVFRDLIQQELRNHPNAEMKIFTVIVNQDSRFETLDSREKKKNKLEIQIPGTDKKRQIEVVEALPKRVNSIFTVCARKKIPIFSPLFDYRNLIVFYPWIMKLLSGKIRKFGPERVVISSFAIGKNVMQPPFVRGAGAKRRGVFSTQKKSPQPPLRKGVLYLHSPMQYIRSHCEEYLSKFTGRKKKLFSFLVPRLQKWDKQYTQFDEVIFNSKYTQQLAKEIYGIEGIVQYPKIHDTFHYAGVNLQPQDYFVCVGRLVTFVRECDLIIKAFNQLKLPLLMIGSGPDEMYLKSIAGDNIIFLGRLSPEETQKIVRNAKGMINLTKESFGMGTVEALLMGVPVIGFNDGATPELVDEYSGILVGKKTIKNLISAIEQFQKRRWDRKGISERIRERILRLL